MQSLEDFFCLFNFSVFFFLFFGCAKISSKGQKDDEFLNEKKAKVIRKLFIFITTRLLVIQNVV